MSIFGSIVSAIFGSAKAMEAAPGGAAGAPAATAGVTSAPTVAPAPSTSAPLSQVDVEAALAGLAARKKQRLDWRKSIVDLMKLLDLDSSRRAQAAGEGAELYRRH
jgi:hypothetical protein